MKILPTSEVDQKPLSLRRLLTETEAATYLGVSKSFVAKKRCTGGGPPFCKIGRRVLYDITDLDSFAEQAKRSSTSE
jgi:excisionase family DNA binding protein